MSDIRYTCAGPRVYRGEVYLGRAGCGEDLTTIIAEVPEDGKVYECVCPKCDNMFTVHKTLPNGEGSHVDGQEAV